MIDIDVGEISKIVRFVAETEVIPCFNNLKEGDIREKNPGDFVTVADEASERIFSDLLPEALTGSVVVGEEAVAKDLSVLDELKKDKPVWVVDPIDGTYNFSHGRSKFGILLSLVQNGVTQYGWAFDALGNRMAVAQKGEGAYLDGKRLKIDNSLKEMSELIGQGGGAQAWHFDPVRSDFKEIRNVRCSLHDYMDFITGEIDFIVHLNKTTPWDHGASNLLAVEAGGYVAIDKEKNPYDPTRYGPAFSLVTSSEECWDRIKPVLYSKLYEKKEDPKAIFVS